MNQIVSQIAAGNPEALAALYDKTGSLVFSTALRILRNTADAEEVTQDVFAYIWSKADKFDPALGAVTTWIVMLARSRAIDRLRATSAQSRCEVFNNQCDGLDLARKSPEDASILSQQQRRLRAALARLSNEQREVFELAFFSGLTHAEVASRLGQPLGTVKTRIRTALSKLREALASTPVGAKAA